MKFVSTVNEFRQNLATRFSSAQWLEMIDFTKFSIVGGCLVNALSYSAFLDTRQQDINLIYSASNGTDFETAVMDTINKLKKLIPQHLLHEIKTEKVPGSLRYDVFLPCGVKLNFLYTPINNSKYPLSHILHNFDMDICQVAFTGRF